MIASAAPDLPVAPEPPHAPSKSRLAMRHGDAPDIALPAGILDMLDHAPRGITPAVAVPANAGANAGAEVAPGVFDATVAPDGTVKLTDRRNVRLVLPAQQALDAYRKSDNTLGGRGGDPAIASHYQPAPGTSINLGTSSSVNALPASASVTHNVDRNGTTVVVPLIGGQFDATDALMRNHGIDPYLARKLKFLDATRDERVQLGNLNRAEQLAHASQLMQRNLDALWTSPRLDLAAKKRALFELWDECAEDGDASLVQGAEDARQLVIDFIRAHVPAGSAGAYTPSELAELARHQQSKAGFQPYAE